VVDLDEYTNTLFDSKASPSTSSSPPPQATATSSGGGRAEGVSRPRPGDAVVGERGRCLSRRTGSTPSAWMRTYDGENEEATGGREN
jgi:hypothetical protein